MEGYAKIAAFMGRQDESAQVLRLSDIALQNILYLQAEIYGLRQDLRTIEALNHQSPGPGDHKSFPFDWYALANTPAPEGTPNEQWAKVLRLRCLLREYHEAVIRYHQLSALTDPEPHVLQALQEWICRPSLGAVYLTGRDREIWSRGVDLVAIGRPSRQDRAAAWMAKTLVPACYRVWSAARRLCKTSTQPNVVEYSSDSISKVTGLGGAVVASLLPVCAIVVLHLVHGTGVRLGLIAIFSAVFSASIWLFGEGKLGDIFSATAAFAAVQVVFIGTSG